LELEITPEATTSVRTRNRRRRTRAAFSSIGQGLGWLLTMVSIIGIYLGGAGVFMIVAGQVVPQSITLTCIGVASLAYMTWFLGFGPGTQSEPTAPAASTKRSRHVDASSLRSPLALPLRCSQCSTVHRDSNRVVEMGSVSLCERCLSGAVAGLSSHWAVRTGLVPGEFDGYGPIRNDLRRARSEGDLHD
jgi:hypothetical protein